MNIKQVILNNKIIAPFAISIRKFCKEINLYKRTKKALANSKKYDKRMFYLGIPAHSNLGDLAQGVCIRRWLKKHYGNTEIVEIETNALVNTRFSVLKRLKKTFSSEDIIVFQSGYTTTDLGGYADEMHRSVMNLLPNAKMLMLPQTIFFKSDFNRERTSQVYNSIKNLLFLARDRVSYEMAKSMFPDISVEQYPDIVTTLIGNYEFDYERNGILFCCRDDSEKFYSDEEIDTLIKKCSLFTKTEKTDTTKKGNTKEIVTNAETLISKEVDTYAHYKAVITDRYHGTILSLVAGTPVIIIKSNDHKVVTGAEWFEGVYDDYVYLAKDLDDAYNIAQQVCNKILTYKLYPYFEKKYYDKLKEVFEFKTKGEKL